MKVNGTARSTATTDSNRQAVFTVSDATSETVTYTTDDTTDNVTASQTASVTFASATLTSADGYTTLKPTAR